MIRWQIPATHIRRTALHNVELGGKTIKKGDRVVMWYVPGIRDEAVFEDANTFRIDRAHPRRRLSFGFGIHRCVGNRLAAIQLKVMWEELLKRFKHIEVVGEPVRMNNGVVKGFEALPVRIAEQAPPCQPASAGVLLIAYRRARATLRQAPAPWRTPCRMDRSPLPRPPAMRPCRRR